jgi:bifunctional non-homologous end joining protein LigD
MRKASRAKKTSTPSRSVSARLETYKKKRDFKRTPEPSGARKKKPADPSLRFVVQKHAASRLHYDFRLELDGVLLSWSIPKGPTLKAGLKRLAVRTEDHPLDYADFEGVIPKGEYGGGTVIVWDRGSWKPEGDAQRGVRDGRLSFELEGEKLHGRFHLVRTRLDAGKRENWLLFKSHDDAASDASDIVNERQESAISGRTLEEVRELPQRVWHSDRAERKSETKLKRATASQDEDNAKGKGKAKRSKPAAESGKRAKPAARSSSSNSNSNSKAEAESHDAVALVKRLPLPFGLSNLDKLLYPEQKLRKAELIAYYVTVASYMLPHVKDRPLTLVRCPNGVQGKCFFQKHIKEGAPDAVQAVEIAEGGKPELYMAVHDLPGLIALAQLGVLEVHTWGCHRDQVEKPDKLVFDIDPDEGLEWDLVIEAAMELRERLMDVGLQSFVQTTGGKGLHVVAPVARRASWEQHKDFSHAIAQSMAKEHPDRYLTKMSKSLRKGKIFLDYLRNGRGATAIAPYSTRARAGATVATPITWDELAAGVLPSDFTIRSMADRISELEEDPWKEYAQFSKQTLKFGPE